MTRQRRIVFRWPPVQVLKHENHDLNGDSIPKKAANAVHVNMEMPGRVL